MRFTCECENPHRKGQGSQWFGHEIEHFWKTWFWKRDSSLLSKFNLNSFKSAMIRNAIYVQVWKPSEAETVCGLAMRLNPLIKHPFTPNHNEHSQHMGLNEISVTEWRHSGSVHTGRQVGV